MVSFLFSHLLGYATLYTMLSVPSAPFAVLHSGRLMVGSAQLLASLDKSDSMLVSRTAADSVAGQTPGMAGWRRCKTVGRFRNYEAVF